MMTVSCPTKAATVSPDRKIMVAQDPAHGEHACFFLQEPFGLFFFWVVFGRGDVTEGVFRTFFFLVARWHSKACTRSALPRFSQKKNTPAHTQQEHSQQRLDATSSTRRVFCSPRVLACERVPRPTRCHDDRNVRRPEEHHRCDSATERHEHLRPVHVQRRHGGDKLLRVWRGSARQARGVGASHTRRRGSRRNRARRARRIHLHRLEAERADFTFGRALSVLRKRVQVHASLASFRRRRRPRGRDAREPRRLLFRHA